MEANSAELQANSLLQAKVEMLRDNLKTARVEAAEKAALQNDVAQLKSQLSKGKDALASGWAGAKPRSLSEDGGGSQSQVWLQLVRFHHPTLSLTFHAFLAPPLQAAARSLAFLVHS